MASMHFTDKDSALYSAAVQHLASSGYCQAVVHSLVHNLYWMCRCRITYGDLKGLNVFLSYKLQGGTESILREEKGKKAVPPIDIGTPLMHHMWAKEKDLARYDPTTETFAKEPVYGTPAKGAATRWAQSVLAESQGEARTVPRPAPLSLYHDIREYSLQELHVQTATAPSSSATPPDEPPPWPVAAVKSWGGTQGFMPHRGQSQTSGLHSHSID